MSARPAARVSADERLVLEVLLDPVPPHLPADTRELQPTVRGTHVDGSTVDAHAAGTDASADLAGALGIGGPDAACEPVIDR